MNPLRNILRLSTGELVARALGFLAFVHLARRLGVETFGVLEWAISVTAYLLLAADSGVDLWATRSSARGSDPGELAGRVVSLRLLLAAAVFTLLLLLLPLMPAYPRLRPLLVIFGLTLFAQAASLKWAFLGAEDMRGVAQGLILAQAVFALAVFALVRTPDQVLFVALARLAADLATAAFFWARFIGRRGRRPAGWSLGGSMSILRPALALGAASALGLMSFNFDTLVIGPLLGPAAVGLYGAAYKPVIVALALPLSWFAGLFPVLARSRGESPAAFDAVVAASVRLLAAIALPIGVGATFLAEPIVDLLFGEPYAASAPIFRLLAWSAVLTILRGTFRQSLAAVGRHDLDLRCAALATGANVVLTVALIPSLGLMGAALATVVSEGLWLALAHHWFHHRVAATPLAGALWPALAAAAVMAGALWAGRSLFWVGQAAVGVAAYAGALILLGQGPPLGRALARDWRP